MFSWSFWTKVVLSLDDIIWENLLTRWRSRVRTAQAWRTRDEFGCSCLHVPLSYVPGLSSKISSISSAVSTHAVATPWRTEYASRAKTGTTLLTRRYIRSAKTSLASALAACYYMTAVCVIRTANSTKYCRLQSLTLCQPLQPRGHLWYRTATHLQVYCYTHFDILQWMKWTSLAGQKIHWNEPISKPNFEKFQSALPDTHSEYGIQRSCSDATHNTPLWNRWFRLWP